MTEAPLIVDLARMLLAVVAGGALLQLGTVTWQDYRARDLGCLPLQLAVLIGLVLVAVDSGMRVGEPVQLHLLIGRALIVSLATGYTLARQGHLDRWT